MIEKEWIVKAGKSQQLLDLIRYVLIFIFSLTLPPSFITNCFLFVRLDLENDRGAGTGTSGGGEGGGESNHSQGGTSSSSNTSSDSRIKSLLTSTW